MSKWKQPFPSPLPLSIGVEHILPYNGALDRTGNSRDSQVVECRCKINPNFFELLLSLESLEARKEDERWYTPHLGYFRNQKICSGHPTESQAGRAFHGAVLGLVSRVLDGYQYVCIWGAGPGERVFWRSVQWMTVAM